MKLLSILLFSVSLFAQESKKEPFQPSFIENVYAISPYGDVARLNPLWFATAETANTIAAKLNTTAILATSSPQTGENGLRMWHVSQVPASLLPPEGARIQIPEVIFLLFDLPAEQMWNVLCPNGRKVNAGYLAGYFARNPEDKFPGLAQKYIDQVFKVECQ